MLMLATRDRRWMSQCDAFLQAEGIASRWLRDESAMVLDVPVSEVERASEGLSILLSEDRARFMERRALAAEPRRPLLLQGPFIFGVGMAFLLAVFYVATGPAAAASQAFLAGRFARAAFLEGEGWRMVTASSLHVDTAHAAGNGAFLVVLGWAAAERIGAGFAGAAWLLTAVAGFAVSFVFTDVSLTVGASGGLFGLLGVSSAHAFRHRSREFRRREGLRTLGSGILLLAFTAFSQGSNISAHVGGFLAGALLGGMLPRRPVATGVQLLAASLGAGALWGAWALALAS